MPCRGTTLKLFSQCLLELHSMIITNALSIQIWPQPKPGTILTMAENTSAPPASGGNLGSSCFLFHPFYLPTESVLSPSPWLCWLNLCIYPDICFGFLSSFQNPSGCRTFPCTQAHLAGALTSCLGLTGLSLEA